MMIDELEGVVTTVRELLLVSFDGGGSYELLADTDRTGTVSPLVTC